MRNVRLLFVFILVLSGCSPKRHEVPGSEKAKPTAEVRSKAEVEPKGDSSSRRVELEKRLRAAIELDGHPQGWEMVEDVSVCFASGRRCGLDLGKVRKTSEACVIGGEALFLLRGGDLDEAERKIAEVEASAEKMGPVRQQALSQQKAVTNAVEACESDRTVCKSRCEQDDAAACTALGSYLVWEDKRPEDGRKMLSKGCDGGFPVACNLLQQAEKEAVNAKENEAKQVEDAWAAVVQTGDDLAQKKFALAFAKKNLSGRRNALAAQRMGQHIEAIQKESYCPAVKEFLAVSTKAEFARRAKDHCEKEPPRTTGLSGAEVELKAECRMAYLATCR